METPNLLETPFNLLGLSPDVLGKVLTLVDKKSRMSVMLTCKSLFECALLRGWPPWADNCKGLIFAITHANLEYYKLHKARAGLRWKGLILCFRYSRSHRLRVFQFANGVLHCVRALSTIQINLPRLP
jgi:hypothetical protein